MCFQLSLCTFTHVYSSYWSIACAHVYISVWKQDFHTDTLVGCHELGIMILIGFLESAIYNVKIKFFKCTASPFTLLYTVQAPCAIYHLYLCTFTHVYVLFPVWSSALVHKDCQSNALTPSICSMVTTSMDVMSHVYGCKLSMLLVHSHLYSSVECVVSIHTVHGHCQVFWVHFTNITWFIYIYVYMHTMLCIHFNVTIITVLVTHSCVWIVLVVFVLYPFSSLTLDTLYIYTYRTCSNHFNISTVQ